jgi:uncharacterized damage-inducible protein DinB
MDTEFPQAFLTQARSYLQKDFLPKIERCLEQLSDDDVWWRAGDESNSVGNLILHLCGNVRQWIVSGIGGERDARVRQAEFDRREMIPRSELLSNLKTTLTEADAVLARVEAAELLVTRRIQSSDVNTLEAIFHVVEHFSMHTGQIILLTKILTHKELSFYKFSNGTPQPTWNLKAGGE